ncbi:hypothetical protein CIPAW_04G074500 [Carya illinoinensis]|uniref:Uncharacterized protein n=1 Tax=Carya illinoinensis TaxID=32201 RepID=A0A8T1QRM7_CARIL|nr:hypothetical protein CIPAW_04G074500 [Carya illinoinensis]
MCNTQTSRRGRGLRTEQGRERGPRAAGLGTEEKGDAVDVCVVAKGTPRDGDTEKSERQRERERGEARFGENDISGMGFGGEGGGGRRGEVAVTWWGRWRLAVCGGLGRGRRSMGTERGERGEGGGGARPLEGKERGIGG